MRDFLQQLALVPHGWMLLAAAVLTCVGQLGGVALAFRRRSSPDGQTVLGVSILVIPLLGALSFRASWQTAVRALAGGTAESAKALLGGLNGVLGTIPLAASGTLIALELWALGVAIALVHREPDRPAAVAWPALAFAGLTATLAGVLRCMTVLIHQMASLAQEEPEDKATVMLASLDFVRQQLLRFAAISRWTILGLGGLALVFAVRAPARLSRRALGRQVLTGAALLLFAATLAIAARPLRAENDLPWPAPSPSAPLQTIDPITPDLEGPDAIERAPVVQVFVDRLLLDGDQTRTPDDLRDRLLTLRNNFGLLQPGAPFNGLAVIVADRVAPMRQVIAALSAAHEAGYLNPVFAFTRREAVARPMLGLATRVHATGVRATLFDRTDDEVDRAFGKDLSERGVVLALKEFTLYESLARRLVAVRRTGSAVSVRLGN